MTWIDVWALLFILALGAYGVYITRPISHDKHENNA